MNHATDLFVSLKDVIEDTRLIWGRKLDLLLIRPTGTHLVALAPEQINHIFMQTIAASLATSARALSFAGRLITQNEALITFTDNGWGLCSQGRQQLAQATLKLRAHGGHLRIEPVRHGSLVVLHFPLLSFVRENSQQKYRSLEFRPQACARAREIGL